ncbi:MAG TPA: carbon-nitrogen hydrolase family protein [Alphaproteobacteria bacterium]|nr:carbon-nitrogen hydrolase family protein [Alphaproteobacteria bacterium]
MSAFTAACVQLNSSDNVQQNLEAAGALIRTAKNQGASLVLLPENCTSVAPDNATRLKNAFSQDTHPAVPFFSSLARELHICLVAGSISIALGNGKIANRCLTFGPDGSLLASYDKIHLYDAAPLPNETYKESEIIAPGSKAVLCETKLAKIGLTICYDLRFPQLFRQLAKAGAEAITVPSAFTVPTGQAHWHVLLRARAIETGCFILAAAQTGTHAGGRRTYGHSLIISPWGEILADAGEEPGVITAEIDLEKVSDARRRISSLQHDREFAGP